MKLNFKLTVYLVLSVNIAAYAEIKTDGTVGIQPAHTLAPTTIGGKDFVIPQNLGTTVGTTKEGTNLFHSFQIFNINTGESATFTGNDSIHNVISRVTGGQVSNIDGLLKSTIPNANFYFINPAGITFGKNAKIDVPASFHVSTANSLKFTDGKEFSVSNPTANTLSIAEPASFGFLGSSSANFGTIKIDGSQLTVKDGNNLDLVANHLHIENKAQLQANTGEIRLVALQNQSDISVLPKNRGYMWSLDMPELSPTASNAGNIKITDSKLKSVLGYIDLWGGNINLDRSTITTYSPNFNLKSHGLNIQANNLTLSNHSALKSAVLGRGDGKDDRITLNLTGKLTLDKSAIQTITQRAPEDDYRALFEDWSSILIDAAKPVTLNHSTIESHGSATVTNTTVFDGTGTILINTPKLRLDHSSTLKASSNSNEPAGNIKLGSPDIKLFNQSIIQSENTFNQFNIQSENTGSGDAGNVKTQADSFSDDDQSGGRSYSPYTSTQGSLKLDHSNITVNAASGYAGGVIISMANVNVLNSNIESNGNGGFIFMAPETLHLNHGEISSNTGSHLIENESNQIQIDANNIKLDNASTIATTSASKNASGFIDITSSNTTLLDNSSISASNTGLGDAGYITISSNYTNSSSSLVKLNNSKINVSVSNPHKLSNDQSDGNAGQVFIAAKTVDVLNGSKISSNTLTQGNAGNIDIGVEKLTIDGTVLNSDGTAQLDDSGQKMIVSTGISSNAQKGNAGHAGTIHVNSYNISNGIVNIRNGGQISSSTYGTGDAGEILVAAIDSLTIDGNNLTKAINGTHLLTGIVSEAKTGSSGKAGKIDVSAINNLLKIDNQGVITSSTFSTGDAGSVDISFAQTDNFLKLNHFGSINSSTYGSGAAGNIRVNSSNITLNNHAEISALAGIGSSGQTGNVTIYGSSNISLFNGSKISVENKAIGNTFVNSSNTGDISVNANDLTIDNSVITASTNNNVNAGAVKVTASSLGMSHKASISSSTAGSGNAGNISVTASDISIDDSSITAKTTNLGSAGSVIVNAVQSLTEKNKAEISALAGMGSSGQIGSVTINDGFNSNISLFNGSKISVENKAIGNTFVNSSSTGDISVNANDLTIDNSVITASTNNNVDAGTINISADIIKANNQASINSKTFSSGRAGLVRVVAKEKITLNNQSSISASSASVFSNSFAGAGRIYLSTPTLALSKDSKIETTSNSQSRSGNIYLLSPNFTLNNSSILASNTGLGDAGNIDIYGKFLNLNNNSKINVSVSNPFRLSHEQNDGNAGKVSIFAKTVDILNSSKISSDTLTRGNAGDVSVTANALTIDGSVLNRDDTAQVNHNGQKIIANTGISSDAKKGSSGHAGDVNVIVQNSNNNAKLNIKNGGQISSSTFGKGNAGDIKVNADLLVIDANNIIPTAADRTQPLTGIISQAEMGSRGNAGTIKINSNNPKSSVAVNNGGVISSSTISTGNAGNIIVNVNKTKIDNGRIDSTAGDNITPVIQPQLGNAGNININGDKLTILGIYGIVGSDTHGKGHGGDIIIKTNETLIDKFGNIFANAYFTGDAGTIKIGGNQLTISGGGWIQADTSNSGKAGNIKITNKNLKVTGGLHGDNSYISSTTHGTGNAGKITVTSDNVTLADGGQISSSTAGKGKAGRISIQANNIDIYGEFKHLSSQISAVAGNKSSGKTGIVKVNATNSIHLYDGGEISIQNSANVTNPTAIKTGLINVSSPDIDLEDSKITAESTGNVDAGNIGVTADTIKVSNQSSINSNTTGSGYAGNVSIKAKTIDILNSSKISSDTSNQGNAGDVSVTANTLTIDGTVLNSDGTAQLDGNSQKIIANTGISSDAKEGSSGHAGNVTITVQNDSNNAELNIKNGGQISSSTFGSGKAGDITVNTDSLTIDANNIISTASTIDGMRLLTGVISQAEMGSSGNAGIININPNSFNNSAARVAVNNGGVITSSTLSTGDAGNTTVNANEIQIDNGSIYSNADHSMSQFSTQSSQLGNAGSVTVNANNTLIATNNASINSFTSGAGKAGNVTVAAPTLIINNANISAAAKSGSSGQTGDIKITASKNLSLTNQSKISIENNATVTNPSAITAGSITVSATDIILNDSKITAESTGNVDAGKINVNFSHVLTLDPSFISTQANTGSGGDITISGGERINLQNSGFLTSVSQANGHGGDINVSAHTLIMDNGIIQADADNGSGGDINLNLQALIPSQNQLIKGGSRVSWQSSQQGENVIQAVSQNGVNGSINITSPQFDISGSLSTLNSAMVVPNLENNPCLSTTAYTSSLARNGKGGVARNETKAVFIPAISEHTNSVTQATAPSNSLSLKESSPCTPI